MVGDKDCVRNQRANTVGIVQPKAILLTEPLVDDFVHPPGGDELLFLKEFMVPDTFAMLIVSVLVSWAGIDLN